MRLEDVKIGMKVVPHSKSVNCGLFRNFKESVQINKMKNIGQKFLYVNKILHDNAISLATELNIPGDMFLASDFEPYIEKTNKQTLELIFNGTTTIAIVKLHHEDTYDKLEGIRVALGRALGLDIELPKEKTIEDFSNEELLDAIKKRMAKEKKYLTYDEIRKLPHGTEIEYTDSFSRRNISKKGFINQEKKWISSPYKIDWNSWNFTSLEKREIQAKILRYAL